jgi:alpha-1,3-glucan synthase
MVARATAPNRIGPGSVFPDASKWDFNDGLKGNVVVDFSSGLLTHNSLGSPMDYPAFWIALICQLIIVWGYFWFYRKEQLGQSLY